jgi:two-component system, sensor histidine kinase and response regulator
MTPQPQKPRVLVVDDRAANRTAYASLLEQDYTLWIADSGRQALEMALKEEFAVILLDVRMPGMDGYETAEVLRSRKQTRYTPVIFMSAFDTDVLKVKRAYIAGATDFLSSPVDEDLLKFKVATYAQLYLQNEAMRIQIRVLGNLVQSLQVDLNRRGPAEDFLKHKIVQLEDAIEELQRQLSPTL